MHTSRMLAALVTALALGEPGLRAAEPTPAATAKETKPKPAKGGGFVFSLLPKSLQKNPRLDFNIITEMTPAGRKLAPPTPQSPTYYISQAGKMVNTGVGAEGLAGPPVERLQQMMTKSLADASYLPGDDSTHRPALVIVYNWGTSSFALPPDVSDENGQGDIPVPEIVIRKTLLDRAMLLGGAAFRKEVIQAFDDTDQKAAAQRTFAAPEGGDFMGSVGDMLPDPFEKLRARNPEMERLVDELFSSSYFVVASAYDYAAVAKGQRVLLWRTKMTVNSLGVNMSESIPPMIATASAYLGRETKEPVVITKRAGREGHVEVGTPTVVPDKK